MKERELFLAALDIEDRAARQAHLRAECAGDAELLARVESLLASHEGQSQFLNTPVVEQIADVSESVASATIAYESGSTHDDDPDATTFYSNGTSPMTKQQDDAEFEMALGYLEPSSTPDSLGRLGHYEVLEVIGRGAFGTVLRAFDEKLHRVVAIKVMSPEMAATSPARKRFLREAQASAAIRHEHVVSVYAVEEKPLPYLVMEFIPGETLQQRLDARGPLDVPTVLHLGRQIAEGLAAAHAQELIHRDIKPGNILLETSVHDRVKITDFGLARTADDASVTQSGTIAGTPMYMAPEQALGQKLDQRADLFSFGSVLYQMVSGRPPFRAATTLAVLKRLAEDTPRPIREIIPETPQWLCDIITKLHAKNPDERYQSAREIADVLANCEAQLHAHAGLKDFSVIPQAKSLPTSLWKWIAAALIVLPMVAFGLSAIYRPAAQPNVAKREIIEPATPGPIKPGSDSTPGEKMQPITPEPLPTTFTNSLGMEFVIVPKGKSWLGGGKDRLGDRGVEIPADFYLGKYEVTQEEWEKVMAVNPSHFSRTGGGKDAVMEISDADLKRFPVETVSWDDSQLFVAKLNQLENETGWAYRLPTSTEWEYACRGGPMTDKAHSAFDFYFAKPTNNPLREQASFGKNMGLNRTGKVGSHEANGLGIFDMHRNVWEWCDDRKEAADGNVQRAQMGGGWNHLRWRSAASNIESELPSHRSNALGLRLARVQSGARSSQAKTPPSATTPFVEADIKRIAALPAADQVEEVRKELKNRNPEFDGTLMPTIENDVVTGIEFLTNRVSDISPVRAFPHLTSLNCRADGSTPGMVSDLNPLKGMQLVKLTLSVNPVSDLAPLKGMPLTDLHIDNSHVADLSPLEGMPLKVLNCSYTKVASLAPLQGMPLIILWCNNTEISSLSPVKGMPLEWITIQETKVIDLSPLKGMPLTQIDLSFDRNRDGVLLRSMTTLQKINDKPAADFWKEVEQK